MTGEGPSEGGRGYLGYVPAYSSSEISFPSSIDGWAAIPDAEFDQLWMMLSSPTGLSMTIKADVGPVSFGMPDRWLWDVQAHSHLKIHAIECTLASPGWYDED